LQVSFEAPQKVLNQGKKTGAITTVGEWIHCRILSKWSKEADGDDPASLQDHPEISPDFQE
jgi:hypothetical protein